MKKRGSNVAFDLVGAFAELDPQEWQDEVDLLICSLEVILKQKGQCLTQYISTLRGASKATFEPSKYRWN